MKMENITNVRKMHNTRIAAIFVFILFTFFSPLSAQCPLGCNNLVQVSLGPDCSTTITPQMILEGEDDENDQCNYRVEILGPNDVPLSPNPDQVDERHIGMTLKVSVILEGSNNSCWGYIKIEDKQAPTFDMECPDTIRVVCYNDDIFITPTATDNCDGPVDVWIVSDITTDLDCEEDTLSARRTIVYQAKDSQGNLSEFCYREIEYQRIGLDDIEFPENLDNISEEALESCGEWDLNGDNFPDPWVDVNDNDILDDGESESGVPRTIIDGYPIYPNNSYCEINATFHDKEIDVCEKSKKYIRHWTLLDWCTAEIRDTNQIIKVIDTTDPEVYVKGVGDIFEYADPYTCGTDVRIPPPDSVFDCTTVEYEIQYMLADKTGKKPTNGQFIDKYVQKINMNDKAPDGRVYDYYYRINDLPVGITWIRYIATDDCGNQTIKETEVIVVDNVPPIPVCDEFTVVTLTATGFAKVYAETFDDGSHDNCTENVFFEVRRLTQDLQPDSTCSTENATFRKYVEFCCADVEMEYMVELRVWDDGNGSGIYGDTIPITKPSRGQSSRKLDTIGYLTDNYNTCMVITTVQDKLDPFITCPPDITVNCGEELWDLSIFGTVREDRDSVQDIEVIDDLFIDWDLPLRDGYADDNCEVKVTETVDRDLNNCQVGEIRRTFTARDPSGRTKSCTQVITVRNDDVITKDSIDWPYDIQLDECVDGGGTDPEDLEKYDTSTKNYGFPLYREDFCSQLAVTYEDQQFNFVDDVCFKILRKWTVIDWCEYDRSGRERGKWSMTQVIKVNDSDAPVIENTSNMTFCIYGPDCGGFIELVNGAEDCTPDDYLDWRYEVKLNKDENDIIKGESNDASGYYPVGWHEITWYVEDMCGNNSKESYIIHVKDCKKPTPYCLSEITTVVMPTTGQITIWANDFDHGSSDNCGGPLRFSFTEPNLSLPDLGLDTAMTFVCPQDEGLQDISMYVIDTSNNYDYCNVTINIQVNHDCGVGVSQAASVSGFIGNVYDEAIDDVNVSLENMNDNQMSYYLTDGSGQYSFTEIPSNNDFKVEAEKNDDIINGVNTLDIVLIQRHILGIKPFDDPYKVIAADINNNKSLAASDIIQLRKVILGIYDEFPDNDSWKFVNAGQTYFDDIAPWEYEEFIMLENLNTQRSRNDFIGIKVGDVDHNAKPNLRSGKIGTRSTTNTEFAITNQEFRTGETVEVTFRSTKEEELLGYQMTLQFNPEYLEYVGHTGKTIEIGDDNLGLTQPGYLSMSWNEINPVLLENNQDLFSITFRAKTNSTLIGNLDINSSLTAAEAYTAEMQVAELSLDFIDEIESQVVLLQNRPNPFTDKTIVSFILPEESDATLTVFDITGKLLHRINGKYAAGENNIELDGNMIPTDGILYYQLEAGNFKSTKKMIKINR